MPNDFSTETIGFCPGLHFVDRDDELNLVESKLKDGGQGQPIRSGVICFWGAFGMGKSWLLKRIEHEYYLSNRKRDFNYPPITSRLDLSREASKQLWKDNQFDRVLLIQELWKQLAKQWGVETPNLARTSPDEWAKAFVIEVSRWALIAFTPIILLDTVDDLIESDEGMFSWLETHLVEPLVLTDRVLFIFTSRGEIRSWNCFQVRRRIDSHRLTAFKENDARDAVDATPSIGKAIYQIAFGHPYTNARLAFILKNEYHINLQNPEELEKPFDEKVLSMFLKQVVDEVLRVVLPENLRTIAWMMSVLRWVSLEPLRQLCETTALEPEGLGDAYYLDDLIGKFQAKHLLYWNSDKNCYEMDPALRKLMAYGLLLNNQDLFSSAHQAAYEFHKNHLEKYPAYLSRYVTELAFHMGTLIKISNRSDLRAYFTDWWNRFLAQEQLPPKERWKELSKELEADQELREILPDDLYQVLINAIQSQIGS